MRRHFLIFCVVAVTAFVVFGVLLYNSYAENLHIFILNFLYLIGFISVFAFFLRSKNSGWKELIIVSTLFCTFFGSLYVIAIYDHSEKLFQFEPSDAPFYDAAGRYVSDVDIMEGVSTIMDATKYGFDDMGMIFYVGAIYKIVDSPILVKVFNLGVNAICAFLLFRIASLVMSRRYAVLATLTFAISSFNIWFLISGLKEPLMILIILLFFDQYLLYATTRRLKPLLISLVVLVLIVFFRIPMLLFMVVSIFAGELLRKGINTQKLVAISLVLVLMLVAFFTFSDVINLYLNRTNPAYFTGEVEKTSRINPALIGASGIFGPFPTILPKVANKYEDVSVYAPSLIFRMFLGIYFVYSLYFLFKEKKFFFIPIIAFCWIEILSLSVIEHTFKLRYAFPHFPFLIISAFYAMYFLFEEHKNGYKGLKNFALLTNIGLIGIIFLWNYLRV